MKDVPDSERNRPTVLEVWLAAEREMRQGTVLGAKDIRGLWRIYPATSEARTQLLVRGIRINKTLVQPSSTNPFVLKDDTGEEKPATKVWIDNAPISVASSEIEEALVKVGCELRSPIKLERASDADKKLTRFLTDTSLRVNIFTAEL